jgi:hypothetical protein
VIAFLSKSDNLTSLPSSDKRRAESKEFKVTGVALCCRVYKVSVKESAADSI